MIPSKKVEELILKHKSLEGELSSGNIDKKLFATKSKEYSDLNEIIKISKDYLIKGFIEDRRSTLETVLNTPSISWIPCYLATWGYLKANDSQKLPAGIQLLKPEDFMYPVADWP